MLGPITRSLVGVLPGRLGLILDIVNKLSGSDPGIEPTFRNFCAFVCNGCRMQLLILNKNLPVWRKVKLSGPVTKDDIFTDLLKVNVLVTDDARRVIRESISFTVGSVIEVNLVNISVDELGFREGAKLGEILARAAELDLIPCFGELAPKLLLQDIDRSASEEYFFAMNGFNLFGCRVGLCIHKDVRNRTDKKVLDTYDCPADRFMGSLQRLVFMKNKVASSCVGVVQF